MRGAAEAEAEDEAEDEDEDEAEGDNDNKDDEADDEEDDEVEEDGAGKVTALAKASELRTRRAYASHETAGGEDDDDDDDDDDNDFDFDFDDADEDGDSFAFASGYAMRGHTLGRTAADRQWTAVGRAADEEEDNRAAEAGSATTQPHGHGKGSSEATNRVADGADDDDEEEDDDEDDDADEADVADTEAVSEMGA